MERAAQGLQVKTGEEYWRMVEETARMGLVLHPVQVSSADEIVQTSSFDPDSGTFTVPPMTTAVFVLPECCQ